MHGLMVRAQPIEYKVMGLNPFGAIPCHIMTPSIILTDSAYKGIQSRFVATFSWVETLILALHFQNVRVFFRQFCLILVVYSHSQPNSKV